MAASRAQRVTTGLAAAGLAATGFLPLFGGPGYEAALAAGLVLPSLAAVAAALDVVGEPLPAPLEALFRGCATGAWLAAVGLLVTVLHGWRIGFCDALEGSEYFALGPGAGAVLGGAYGAFVGLVASRVRRRHRSLAVAGALAGPIACVAASFARFYTSPMVFAFDPFFGFFAGTLYDSVITGLDRLVTYRAGTLATLVAALATAALFERTETGAFRVRTPFRRGLGLLALASAGASAVHVALGPSLGHFQTTSSIRAALGHAITDGRCELVYPAGVPLIEARALARECDGHLRQLDRFFDARGPSHVVAFLFESPEQKGYLMGAASTYIAKPWRREIYIQRAGFPHPVMRHELAHVVAGTFGVGPFHIAGAFHGLIPDPGRIEGLAVAAAPDDEELSLDDWAKAMKDLSLLPPLERVFDLGFFGEPSSRAYVVAGAFIDWLRRAQGIEVVRRWYSGASLQTASGKPLATLERAWLASLDARKVSADVLRVARARFDQPAIFGRRCPHVVDRLAGEAFVALSRADVERARRLYEQLLALDPHDVGARLGLATCALRNGNDDQARALYERVASDPSLAKATRARAVESLGDLALASGDDAAARRRFDEVATSVVDTDRLRALDVKRYASEGNARDAIVAQVLGDPRTGRDVELAAAKLGAWSEREPSLGLADYLLARIYLGEGRYSLVASSLSKALARQIPIASVSREAQKLRMTAACVLDDRSTLTAAYAAWSKADGIRAPERTEMAEFFQRCTGELPPTGRPIPSAAKPALPAASSPPSTPVGCPEGTVRIPGAETWIGSPRGAGADDEWPRYRTRLAAFCLDRTEVTAGAYRACVSEKACTAADSRFVTCTAGAGEDDLPINCLNATQAATFCSHRGARLPAEAEWEYAASGGDDRVYSWGDQSPDGRTCWKNHAACPVGTYPAGAFGLFDMTGDVWEWTSTGYGDYPWPPVQIVDQVYRGGSWSRRFDKWMRVRLRNRAPPSYEGAHLGFRCAVTLPGEPCPFGRDANGECLAGALEVDCRPGKSWNGQRCAAAGESLCPLGTSPIAGHGCVFDVPIKEGTPPPLDVGAVRKSRSPEFDADCMRFQPSRPHAYRFADASHEARNVVERGIGCKNRDVGVGWNSACCP